MLTSYHITIAWIMQLLGGCGDTHSNYVVVRSTLHRVSGFIRNLLGTCLTANSDAQSANLASPLPSAMFPLRKILIYIGPVLLLYLIDVLSDTISAYGPTPKFVNSTIYSTDPRISYHPNSQCAGTPLGACNSKGDPWELVSYTSSGTVETFFGTVEKKAEQGAGAAPGLLFEFKGSAVYLYGAPRRRLKNSPGWHVVCLDNICTTVDVAKVYSDSSRWGDKPVLFWSRDGLKKSHTHKVHLHRLESGGSDSDSGMTFHHLKFTEVEPKPRPQWKPKASEQLVDVVYTDTNPYVSYSSTQSQSTWNMQVFPIKGLNQSFHVSPIVISQAGGDNIPEVRWSFKGASIAVYGAPKSQLPGTPGHSELCLNRNCHPINAIRIYNNTKSLNDPVLLYSSTELNPRVSTSAVLRSLGDKSPIRSGGEVLTFMKAVFQEVKLVSPPSKGTTAAQKAPKKHRIQSNDKNIQYLPSQRCTGSAWKSCVRHNLWDTTTYFTKRGAEGTFRNASTQARNISRDEDIMALLPIPRGTSSIDLYGAPRSQLIHPHAHQEACLDTTCYPIDIEQAYLNVDGRSEDEPVLIWSIDDLDSSRYYTLVMKLINRSGDVDRGVREITFAEMAHWEGTRPKTAKGSKSAPKTTVPTSKSQSSTTENSKHSNSQQTSSSTNDVFLVVFSLGLICLGGLAIIAMFKLRHPTHQSRVSEPWRSPSYQQLGSPQRLHRVVDGPTRGDSVRHRVEAIRQWGLKPQISPQQPERRQEPQGSSVSECVICNDKEASFCLIPCGHLCLCGDCCTALRSRDLRCPVCRSTSTSTLRVYR